MAARDCWIVVAETACQPDTCQTREINNHKWCRAVRLATRLESDEIGIRFDRSQRKAGAARAAPQGAGDAGMSAVLDADSKLGGYDDEL